MNQEIKIVAAKTPEEFLEAKKLIIEYVDWLLLKAGPEARMTLSSQNIEKEMETLSRTYSFPDGALFFAWNNGHAVAVAGIKRFNERECELKRMFVQEKCRGLGIGDLLLTECIENAKILNYESIKLDTLAFMKSAINLYIDHGFSEIPAYRHNTHREARFFELDLRKSIDSM